MDNCSQRGVGVSTVSGLGIRPILRSDKVPTEPSFLHTGGHKGPSVRINDLSKSLADSTS
ncbi:hypothetical protein PAXRUDRAFT_820990 [Paxillus rubicundulus Ve08.2h10]|uniref:Uncharacterized protein n=1 Tax=Paxillus rubicundulus Ve08.2h10 TaxID=930991 RepID=A0A0D0E731_9AGAM|nr:hypothetical protein PAXRUDRAFT_820990 [Paxillus rubicundulus Ve08.2h10]